MKFDSIQYGSKQKAVFEKILSPKKKKKKTKGSKNALTSSEIDLNHKSISDKHIEQIRLDIDLFEK